MVIKVVALVVKLEKFHEMLSEKVKWHIKILLYNFFIKYYLLVGEE